MKTRLLFHACAKFGLGLLTVCALLFVPAGTWRFWRGWLLTGLVFVPMFLAGLFLWWRAPELLAKRLRGRETEQEQRQVILWSGLMFIVGFVVAGLDFRFGWSRLPAWLSLAAGGVLLVGYGLYAGVLRENQYLSRTIEVQREQKVVDSGLYALVRHPMYAATLLLFLAMPLVCGSFYAFLVFLLYPFLIVKRIRNEEALLRVELPGYEAYLQKVRYRLIPFIW